MFTDKLVFLIKYNIYHQLGYFNLDNWEGNFEVYKKTNNIGGGAFKARCDKYINMKKSKVNPRH